MKSFANEIASAMSDRIESDDHKSIFGTSVFSKTAAKKDEKDDDKKDKKNPFAKKDDKEEDKEGDKKKKEDDEKKAKAETLHAMIQSLKKISSDLDSFDFIKSSMYAVETINMIVSEATGAYSDDMCVDESMVDDTNDIDLEPEDPADMDEQLGKFMKDQNKVDLEPEDPADMDAQLDKFENTQHPDDDIELTEEEAALLKHLDL